MMIPCIAYCGPLQAACGEDHSEVACGGHWVPEESCSPWSRAHAGAGLLARALGPQETHAQSAVEPGWGSGSLLKSGHHTMK